MHKFQQNKSPISIFGVNIAKTVVSVKVPFGKMVFRYFIGYENDYEKFIPLCILLPKMSAHRRDFDETKYMYFLIKDNEFAKKHYEIWDKVSNTIKKGFDSEPV